MLELSFFMFSIVFYLAIKIGILITDDTQHCSPCVYAASSEPMLSLRGSLGLSLCGDSGSDRWRGSGSTKWWSEGRLRRLLGSKVGDTTPGDTAGGLLGDTVILKVYLVLG